MTTITDSTLGALRARFQAALPPAACRSTSADLTGMPGGWPTTSASSCGRC